MDFEKILFQYLQRCDIEVSENYIQQRIKSHPAYPTFISIVDTFKELGIEFKATKCTPKDIPALSYPFLAGINSAGALEIIPSESYITSNNDFLKRWNGIALMVPSSQIIQDISHNIILHQEKSVRRNTIISLITGLVLFTIINLIYFKLFFFLLSLLSIGGILISYLIILQITGASNIFTEWFCSTKSHNCNLVLYSKPAKIIKKVHPGEIGLIYFSALLLFSVFNLISEPTTSLLLLIIPFFIANCLVLISIWYQWRVIKVWCTMCLFVAGIIGLQTVLLVSNLSYEDTFKFITLSSSLALLGTSILLGSIWLYLKPFLLIKKNKGSNDVEILKWKRNPFIFQSLLYRQKRAIDIYPDNPLIIGNQNAPLKFIMIAAPFSSTSAEVFYQMRDLYKCYPQLVSFSVVFRIRADNEPDRRTIAASYIIKAALFEKNNIELLNDWFATMEIDLFLLKYPNAANSIKVDDILKLHQNLASYNIHRTVPTVFLNGYKVPTQYSINDLKYMCLNSNLINVQAFSNAVKVNM